MDFGHHCFYPQCARLDFLPFTCDCCGQVFCKDHCGPVSHDCPSLPKPSSECAVGSTSQQKGPLSSFHCFLSSCDRRELVEVVCPHCDHQYCLSHRHPPDHDCPSLKSEATSKPPLALTKKAAAATSATCSTKKVLRGARSKSTSAKVAMMRMKLKADGPSSVPQSERVYYEISFPKEYALSSCPLFISKEWSVGRAVDFIADKFKLRNDNDQPHTPKLTLHTSEGQPLSMALLIKTLLSSSPSGSSLTLEYTHTDI